MRRGTFISGEIANGIPGAWKAEQAFFQALDQGLAGTGF
jgi:hypothetical protein